MRVYGPHPWHLRASAQPLETRATSSGDRTGDAKSPAPAAGGISGQFADAIGALSSLPEVREQLVQAARERLAEGDYITRESAEQTARAFLASRE